MIERDGNQVRVSGALTIANAAVMCEEAKRHFSGDVIVDLAAVTEVDAGRGKFDGGRRKRRVRSRRADRTGPRQS